MIFCVSSEGQGSHYSSEGATDFPLISLSISQLGDYYHESC